MSRSITSLLVRLAPSIFVVLWATGFIGAKYAIRDAEPLTFLLVRFAATLHILLPFLLYFLRDRFGPRSQMVHSFFAGMLIHGVYLGCVFFAISKGMPAGLSALIITLQPFLTAFIAKAMLGETLSIKKAGFFLLALGGVAIVLFPDFEFAQTISGVTLQTVTISVVAVVGMSLGSVYQKKYVTELDLWVSTLVQYAGASIAMLAGAFLLEEFRIEFTPDVTFALAWLVLVLSIGAIGLLMFLIRQKSTVSVASLFYLVPVVSMIMAWFLFNEQLTLVQLLGSAVVVASVALANRSQ